MIYLNITEGTLNAMIEFMNLFFPPMIAIYIYFRRKKEKIAFSLPLIVKYCIVTVLVFAFAKILSQIVNIFYPLAIPLDRAPYTLFAIVASVLLPFLIEFVQRYFRFEIKVESNENEEK